VKCRDCDRLTGISVLTFGASLNCELTKLDAGSAPVPVREPVKRLFEYEPNKPLTVDRSIKD